MNERIFRWMVHLGISRNDFANSLGINVTSLSHLASGRNKPSADLIEKLSEVYPILSMEWLIRGKGEMIESGNAIKTMRLQDIDAIKVKWAVISKDHQSFGNFLETLEKRIFEE